MDLVASPLLTVIINVVAQALVSKGIIDAQSRDQSIQLIRDSIVSLSTAVIGIYSIYKMVDLHKHKISSTVKTDTGSVKTDESLPVSQKTTPMATVTAPVIPGIQSVHN